MNPSDDVRLDFSRSKAAPVKGRLHRFARGSLAGLLGVGLALAGLFAGSSALAANVTVSWNPNPESDISGYRLAYGTTLGVYNNQVNVGTNPTTSVTGLTAGTTYYFVVSAINQAGLQSQPSPVVSYWVPTVTPTNRAPVALANSLTVPEDTARNLVLTGTDADNNPLTFSVVKAPTRGVLSGTPPNLRYTPAADYYGSDSFTFIANDGSLSSAAATVSITVSPVNDAPVAVSKTVTSIKNTPLSILLGGSDKDSFTLTYTVVTPPINGALSGTAPNLTYSPAANFVGSDKFTYRVRDGALDSAVATITITVAQAGLSPTAPVATPQAWTVAEDTARDLVLAGTDANSDPLTFSVVNGPAKGVLTGTGPNRKYTPNADYNGSDSFTFTASDGALTSAPATISITVSPVNDAPLATSKSWTTNNATPLAILLEGSDKEASALAYTVVTAPTNGTLSGTAPNLTYTPATNFVGTDKFTFRTNDGALDSALATMTIDVTQAPAVTPPVTQPPDPIWPPATPPSTPPTNISPRFISDPITLANAKEGKPYTGATLAGTAVDTDVVTYWKVSGPAWLQVATNGDLSGTPPPNGAGLNSFVVRAADSSLATADAELRINVTGLPLPWKSQNIGGRRLTGASFFEAGKFTQSGFGAFGGATDTLRFTYQILTRNGAITARVRALPENGINGRFGVMIRSSLAQNSPQVFMGLNNETSYCWVTRSKAGGKTTTKTSTTRAKLDTWVRLVSENGRIMAYRSANGINWSFVGMARIDMPDDCYVGLAVSSGNHDALRTVQFTNVAVTP